MLASLWRLLRIDRNEIPLLNSLFWLHFLVVASFTLAKAARDTLFLEQWPAQILPWVNIVLVAWTLVSLAGHQRLTRGRTARPALGYTLSGVGLSMLGFYLLPASIAAPTAMLLYVWGATAGLILISQFWAVAEEATDPRSARRLYSVISAGGILGGFTGGLAAALLGRIMGGHGPLLAAALVMLASAPVASHQPVRAPTPVLPPPQADAGKTPREVLKHPYVQALALLMLVSGMASAVLDFKFKLAIQSMMSSGPELAVFLGNFYAVQNLAAFLLQVVFGGWLLSNLGARWTASLLPIGVAAASFGGLFLPVYPLVAVARLYDAVMRVSVTSTATEFFFFPMADDFRRKVKLLIDSVVSRISDALGALLLVAIGAFLPMDSKVLWWLLIAITIAWLGLLMRVGQLYVTELSQSLRRMVMAPPTNQTAVRESRLNSEIRVMLNNPSPERALYALSLLEESDPSAALEKVPELLKHPAAAVRRRAIELALEKPDVVDLLDMEALLHDDHDEVRVWAALFFSKLTPGSPIDNLEELLESPTPRVRGSALHVVVQHARPDEAERVVALVRRFLERDDPADRLAVAQVSGLPEAPAGLAPFLDPLIRDPDPRVRQAAMTAAARTGRRSAIPLLLAALGRRGDRTTARAALAAWGERIVGTLGDHLIDDDFDPLLRRQIPRVLAQIASQDAVNNLLRVPLHKDRLLDLQVVKALNRIRAASRPVVFPDGPVTEQIQSEARQITVRLVHRQAVTLIPAGRGRDLLLKALDERIDAGQDRLFRRLALLYPPREIHLAFLGLAASSLKTRAQSVEYLASTLAPSERMSVLPLVDLLPDEERVNNAASFFRFQPRTPAEALTELATGPDAWLAACALFVIGEARLGELGSLIRRGVESTEPVVQDTARWADRRLHGFPAAG
ncbi:MAG TPA: HEAT repeat domain-containing protein [Candidatus Eisenbacteria bacterium]